MPATARNMHTEESAEVEVLLANMDKLKTLTKKIQGSLNRLDTSGRSVQDAIRPIYGNTTRLQTTNANIDRINTAIDKIKQPLDKRRREEPIIRAGIKGSNLSDYLAALDRTTEALTSLKESNMKSNQQAIAELNNLMRYGCEELEKFFRNTLVESSHPVEPLYYITKSLPFPSIPSENTSKLRLINSYMKSSTVEVFRSNIHEPRTATTYAGVRGPYLTATLQNLATASVTTVKKTDPTALYRQGQSGIGSYCKTMEELFNSEYDNLCEIFAREQWATLHTRTCQDPLNEFARTLKELHGHIQATMVTDCFLAFEIVDVVSRLCTRLDSRNPELRPHIQEAVRPIRSVAKYSLTKLIEDIRNRVQMQMALPADGSPVQITYDAMIRLQTMTGYLIPLGSLLASVGDGGWRPQQSSAPSSSSSAVQPFDVGASGEELFSSYLADTLEALFSSLDSKARTLLRGKAAHGVFMANNIAVVERYLESPDLASTLSDNGRTKVEAWRKKAINTYGDAWMDCARTLTDKVFTSRTSNPGRPPSGSTSAENAAFVKGMSGKEKDNIKEQFKNFNNVFDELVAKHRTFRIEKEIRVLLQEEVRRLIEPFYGRFWDRYHEIDKGKTKHVKYDKSQLSAILHGL